MKVFLISDIHVDFYSALSDSDAVLHPMFEDMYGNYFTPADAVCIAGDVANYEGVQLSFLRFISRKYREVYVVFGNHDLVVKRDFPGRLFDTSEERMEYVRESISESCPNVHILDGQVDESGLFGGTMGVCDLGYRVENGEPFNALDFWSNRWFDGRLWNYRNQVFPDILARELENLEAVCKAKPRIVMTHYCPLQMGVAEVYRDDPVTAMFYFDAQRFLDMLDDGTVWQCGHTHNQFDTVYTAPSGNRVRIVCNPLGYPEERNAFMLNREAGTYLVEVPDA